MRKKREGMYIIIVGCGRIGSMVASRMSASGDRKSVV